MKLWKKYLSGILSAAMLVGMLPTSALAVHAPITSDGGQGLAKEASLYINETAADTELEPVERTEAMYLNRLATSSSVYPYTIPITPGQTETEIYAKAGVTMSNTVANSLETAAYELDVERTKFVILMALDENMTLDTSSTFLFNSTFLMPDEEQMKLYAGENNAINVAEDTSYQSDYQSDTAKDRRWSISGDLDALYIKNPNESGTQTSNAGGFQFRDFFSQNYQYIDDNDSNKGSQAGEAVDYEWNDFTGDGNISNMKFYAIPVKMNWSAIAGSADQARVIYDGYTQEDWKCPMELTVAKGSGSPYEGVKITIDLENPTSNDAAGQCINSRNRGSFDTAENLPALPTTGIDSFIWTTDDADPYNMYPGRQVMGLVNSMPVAGAIVGSIWRLNDVIVHEAKIIHPGHIYIQFALATPGAITVTKTIEGLPKDAVMPDSLAITITDQNGNPARDLNGDVVTASIVKGDWKYDEETGNWTATKEITGLRPSDDTYGWDYQYKVEVAEEDGFDGYVLDGAIKTAGNENLVLNNQYKLSRDTNGKVICEKTDDAVVPEVKVTSIYKQGSTTPEDVTLTYNANGGSGAEYRDTYEVNADVTVMRASDVGFSREGYTFAGWNTEADGSGTAYQPGDRFQIAQDTTLYARWTKNAEWNGSEVSKIATNLDSKYESEVTLSLPAADYQKEVDVVFAIDGSSAQHNIDVLKSNLKSIVQELSGKDKVILNVGVLTFGNKTQELSPLTEVNAQTLSGYLTDLTMLFTEQYNEITTDSGTNVQLGVRKAAEMLATGDALDKNKYLVLFTDGGAHWYCNEDGVSVSQYRNTDGSLYQMQNGDGNQDAPGSRQNDSKYLQHLTESEDNDFGTFIASQGSEIEKSAAGSISKAEAAAAEDDPVKMAELLEQAWTNEELADFSKYPYINMERGTYFAAQELMAAQQKGYQITVIGLPYQAGEDWRPLSVSEGFKQWTETVGDYYPIDELETAFDSIANELGQYVDDGSKVVDEIGSGTDDHGNEYDFAFVKDMDRLTLTVGGTELAKEQINETTYGFGKQGDNSYQFVLHYYETGATLGSENYGECFVLDINVPVTLDAPVQLTYAVDLTNPQTASGTYGKFDADGSEGYDSLCTNNSATLFPVDSDGNTITSVDFPKPTVSYTVGSVKITPADLTIYMGGDNGYEASVGDDGEIPSTNNSLPQPIFLIETPTGESADGMVITSTDDSSGTAVVKTWTAHVIENINGTPSQYYTLEAAANQDPVRVTYTGPDGEIHLNDTFDIEDVNELFAEYTINLYRNQVDPSTVTATIDGAEYPVDTEGAGTLTVRTVVNTEDNAAVSPVVTEHPTEALEKGTGLIVVDPDTNYTVNDLDIPVPEGAAPSLLFDNIVTSDGVDREDALEDKVAEQLPATSGNQTRHYQSQYLDLVDANNGNIWLKASEPITVYWAYPENTDADDDFTLWHFAGLHRDGEQSGIDIDHISSAQLEQVDIKKGEYGISFEVQPGGFSPFVLSWTTSGGTGGNHSSGGGDNKPDDLNTEDHFAYIIGYPKDYRTGEPTDDESLWPVEPQGNITRAEVATIFFRMLTDDARNENWSQTNSFTDVASTEWYNNAISTLANMGIISGDPDGSFRPDDSITRAEFTKIAVGFFDKAGDYVDGTYEDVSASDWYADFIDAAVDLGLIEGYPDGTIRPNASITRAEACTIVNRTLGRVPDKDHLLAEDEMRVWPDNSNTNAWYYAQIQEATNSHDYNWITEDGEEIEEWTDKLADRDWAQLEREWSDANSAPGGEVVD